MDNRRLSGPVESIHVNVGDPSNAVKESGSRELKTAPKSSEASDGSQRGHSTQRLGKPAIRGRATACEVGA
jgi:hypothetical protein